MVRRLEIIKVPRKDPIQDLPPDFPPLDNLHLELLENKKKLKRNLPAVPPPKIPTPTKENTLVEPKGNNLPSEKPFTQESIEDVEKESSQEEEPVNEIVLEEEPKENSDQDDNDEVEGDEDDVEDDVEGDEDNIDFEEDEDEDFVKSQLGEEDEEESPPPPKKSPSKSSSPQEEQEKKPQVHLQHPPAEEKDEDNEEEEYDMYAGMSPEEREEMEKEEYIWRFRILKKKHSKRDDIPEFNEHSDLAMMKKTYNRTIKELYLDDAVSGYKTWLMGGFMGIEFLSTQFIGIDLSGFTSFQAAQMHKYESMLIELGEKSHSRWGQNIPVEIRLIGFILLQAGLFYIGKMIEKGEGAGSLAQIFNAMTGVPVKPQENRKTTPQREDSSENLQAPKKRMRGPRIKPEDIS